MLDHNAHNVLSVFDGTVQYEKPQNCPRNTTKILQFQPNFYIFRGSCNSGPLLTQAKFGMKQYAQGLW